MELVFFGSGPVAAKSLELLSANFKIEAVVSKNILGKQNASDIRDAAKKLNLPAYYPSNKNELAGIFQPEIFQSKMGVVIDYGLIIPESVINYFPLGIVNSHFSLLPELRGPDPITFAILKGLPATGVSLMLIDAGIDTGELLAQKSLPIDAGTTAPSLTDQLINLSDRLLTDTLPKYAANAIKPYPQDVRIEPTFTRKLTKEDGLIDWKKPAEIIEREIRAYIDWPKSYTQINGLDIIVTMAKVLDQQGKPGSYHADKDSLVFYCGRDALSVETLKPAGKKEMPVKAFLAGYHL